MVQKLKERYARYVETARKVRRKAPATAGLFGMGDDPRKNPCHEAFYEDVASWAAEFRASNPDEKAANEAVSWIIEAAAEHRDEDAYWFMYAVHGHCKELIPLLAPADCARLVQFYDEQYPRRDRMPVQKEVYRLLKKRAGK